MEKFFMIIILCVYGECNGLWQNTTYDTMNDCLAASPSVKEYFMSTYPESTGQIYCLIEEEFDKWKKQLETGKPLILPGTPAI